MALMFFPRGGSSQVARYLARSLPDSGWEVSIGCGSLGDPGEPSHAETFYSGLDVHPLDYTRSVAAPDPLRADPPFQPSYEDRDDVPDRVFAAVGDEAYERLVGTWERELRRAGAAEAGVLHLNHLTPMNEAAARRFADVTGVDYVPALLEQARERAAAERVAVEFEEGDAEDLPFLDGSFDVVLSTFGAMFAPNQEQAARELLRACRPGGRIGLANWTPDGWIGEMLRTVGRHVAPPAGLRPPTRWGTEDGLRELFGDGIAAPRAARQSFVWRFASAQQYLDLFRTYYGPVLKAFAALDGPGQAALARDLIEAVERFNRSDDGTLVVPADYLEVVATRR